MEITVGAQASQGEGVPGLESEMLPGGPVAETMHIGPPRNWLWPTTRSSLPSTSVDCVRKHPHARRISSDRQRHRKKN